MAETTRRGPGKRRGQDLPLARSKDAALASLACSDRRGIGGHHRVLEWDRGSVRPVRRGAAAGPQVNPSALQHDDHIWLTVHGEAWAIAMMKDGKILLWRGSVPCDGFEPNIEWLPLRATDWDHVAYADEMSARLTSLAYFAQWEDDR